MKDYYVGSFNIVHICIHVNGADIPFNIMQKASAMHRKDGSSVRPKGSILEKAIRELEKMVAECKFNACCIIMSYTVKSIQQDSDPSTWV